MFRSDTLELYLHIPFCARKCAYCDFLSFPATEEAQRVYVDALLREIRQRRESLPVSSVFFGGGTPSLLPAAWIAELMRALRETFLFCDDAEITIEANPGTVDPEKLQVYRAAGVGRISFGAQSFHEEELQRLGRIHTREEILRGVQMAREAGFANVNLDLMFGLPGQTLASWEKTLREAIALDVEHISAYSLILEEGTALYSRYHSMEETSRSESESNAGMEETAQSELRLRACAEGRTDSDISETQWRLPTEDEERAMAERAAELLAAAGYRQYEISNFAKEGHECRHNIGYWTGVPYLGFGLGAASYMPADSAGAEEWLRWNNTRDLTRYCAGMFEKEDVQRIGEAEQKAEFLILGLRRTDGVEDAEYRRRFGVSLEDDYKEVLQKHTAFGHLCREGGRTFFSPQGMAVSNAILVDFLP